MGKSKNINLTHNIYIYIYIEPIRETYLQESAQDFIHKQWRKTCEFGKKESERAKREDTSKNFNLNQFSQVLSTVTACLKLTIDHYSYCNLSSETSIKERSKKVKACERRFTKSWETSLKNTAISALLVDYALVSIAWCDYLFIWWILQSEQKRDMGLSQRSGRRNNRWELENLETH